MTVPFGAEPTTECPGHYASGQSDLEGWYFCDGSCENVADDELTWPNLAERPEFTA